MASHSPQRSRRPPQPQQLSQGTILNHQTRDASPSPSIRERPRALKGQSMPMVPSVTGFNGQQPTQPSPTISNRRSPPPGQVQRLLPTPPHPNPVNFADDSPPPSNQVINANPHYPRSQPALRAPTAAYPHRFIELESQMTPEFFADIDRAAEQAQYQSNQGHSYPSATRAESPSSGKGTAVDKARAPADGSSPSNPDSTRTRRDQHVARESPQNLQQPSPITFQSHTPDRPVSPGPTQPTLKPGEPHPASYLAQYNAREAASATRRATNSEPRLTVSMANMTPPLQNIPVRAPDRSLPVQEEDEVTSKNTNGLQPDWKVNNEAIDQSFRSPSPTPSSDLNPDGSAQKFENAQSLNGHRDGTDDVDHQHDDSHAQFVQRDSTEEDVSYTPRSPSSGLPEDNREAYYPAQNPPLRAPHPISATQRGKTRNGPSDHITRGLESTLLDQQHPQVGSVLPQQGLPTERDSRQGDQRQKAEKSEAEHYRDFPAYSYNHNVQQAQNGRYVPPQVYPDDFQSYGDEYLQPYFHSPRPNAPIPPTPHSQTAASSPSPFLPSYGQHKDMMAYKHARAAGSPYPSPFNHVYRSRPILQQGGRYFSKGVDQTVIVDKIAGQWQKYANNVHGEMTDSTFSPSSTPFPEEQYAPWAYMHSTRLMREKGLLDPQLAHVLDSASITSSPSHQPVPLPFPSFSNKQKDKGTRARRKAYTRQPPPRVESTQPRETSPELSSSGEETAGEYRHAGAAHRDSIAPDPLPFPVTSPTTDVDSDSGEWIDEDEEDYFEDLLDLDYHPSFVKNVGKRRRKWEVGWENLIQAFQALDRQTDATMLLLASPSHTTKLYAVKSRSIRKHAFLSNSTGMNDVRSGFAHIASRRRETRPEKIAMGDKIKMGNTSSSGGDGSDGSSGTADPNMRKALEAAIGSLSMMGEAADHREARVLEELKQAREDRGRVELLLRHMLVRQNAELNTPTSMLAS